MRRGSSIVLITLGIALLLIVLAGVGGWLYLRTSLPQTEGIVTATGLDGSVEIVRDANGVPHIFASTDHDALFALGYVHAQDRMWQLEMNRRIGSGRLSEVLGEATLGIDKFQRTMGYRRVAAQNWEVLSAEGQAALEAYAAGINAWIAEGHTLPPEFLLIGVAPEPWTPLDSLIWVKMMQWDLGGDYPMEILRTQATAALGPERAAQILPAYPEDGITTLPEDGLSAEWGQGILALDRQMQETLGMGGIDVGSNNWVIAGSRTETGMPMLANDPHLGASIPSIWYLAEVQGDRLHVTGATFPGVPLFPIGHNEQIAWGATNVNPDVQDLYLERINPANPNEYEVNGAWVPMTVTEELIAVDGQAEPLRWAARSTRHGPMLSDVESTGAPAALRWTALDPDDTTLDAYMAINYAHNWEEFSTAMEDYVAPSQNFVYADIEGNIGYFVPGRIPIRAQGDGMLPVPGWNDDYAWTGFIPTGELPQVYNPEQGYVATANNRVVDDRYPYMLGNDWAEPYRAERIIELIEEKSAGDERISREDMAAIQADRFSAQVQTLLPFLLSVSLETDRQRDAVRYLQEWDGDLGRDSTAAAIYVTWQIQFEKALIEDDVRGALWDMLSMMTRPVFLQNIRADETLQRVWCDNVLTSGAEGCQETALVALDRALDELSDRMGTRMDRWQWGNIHITQYPHRPFSDVSYLKWFFHRTIGNGGDANTVNVAPVRINDPYKQFHVVSYRQVVDLQDFQRSLFMTTTGQSGNVLSPHYDDFIAPHQAIEYLPMTFGRDAAQGDLLTLQP